MFIGGVEAEHHAGLNDTRFGWRVERSEQTRFLGWPNWNLGALGSITTGDQHLGQSPSPSAWGRGTRTGCRVPSQFLYTGDSHIQHGTVPGSDTSQPQDLS